MEYTLTEAKISSEGVAISGSLLDYIDRTIEIAFPYGLSFAMVAADVGPNHKNVTVSGPVVPGGDFEWENATFSIAISLSGPVTVTFA